MASWQRVVARMSRRVRPRAASRAARFAVVVPALVACVSVLNPSAAAVRVGPPPAAAVAPPPTTLTVVAHEDDDILFVNPDVSRDIAAGRRVVTVFATAGDAGGTTRYWRGR